MKSALNTFFLAGDLYVHAQGMFDSHMYIKLLAVVDMGIKQARITNSNFEAEYVCSLISCLGLSSLPKTGQLVKLSDTVQLIVSFKFV